MASLESRRRRRGAGAVQARCRHGAGAVQARCRRGAGAHAGPASMHVGPASSRWAADLPIAVVICSGEESIDNGLVALVGVAPQHRNQLRRIKQLLAAEPTRRVAVEHIKEQARFCERGKGLF